jgi:putative ABC transport system permease protein
MSARVLAWIDDVRRDLKYAVRSLARSRGFTVAAILTLSVGIGATTAIYSVVDTILLQPLPYPDSDRLVRIVENWTAGGRMFQRGVTHQEFLDWRTRATTLSETTAIVPMGQRMVRIPQGAVGLWGAMVSPNTFSVFQVRAMLGRTIGPDDSANPDVVVLSDDTWRRHFNADPAVVGRGVEFRAGSLPGSQPPPPRLLTVVGVLSPDFEFPTGPIDYFTPIVVDPSKRPPQVTMIARLAPGVSLPAAVEEANLIGGSMRSEWPIDAPALTGPRFEVQRLKDQTVRALRPALRVFLASVVVVLLIVCANVANLLLARGAARQREVAVRLAIGATRARIVRQILTECLVLAMAGGVLGAVVGAAGVAMVKELATVDAPGIFRFTFGPSILPRQQEVSVNLKILGIAFGIAMMTSAVFGVLPALQLSRTNHLRAMGVRGGGSSRNESRLRSALVVGQLVLATALLVGAGLLTHSFIKLSTVNKGYNASNVLAFNLLFPDQYSTVRKAETIQTVLDRLRGTANVRSAGFARHGVLITEELSLGTFVPQGRTLDDLRKDPLRSRVRSVSDGYLTAMGVPVLSGRELDANDNATAQPVIVINQAAARRYFGDTSAVGQVMDWHLGKTPVQVTVVGVVDNVRQKNAGEDPYPEVYVDYRQLLFLMEGWIDLKPRQDEWAIGFLSFAIRTSNDPALAVPTVRQVVIGVDPNIGIDTIMPMSRLVASSLARQRFYAVLLGVFAGVAGLLAAIGIYGVLAYAVVQRTHEIGVRMALGAQRRQVIGLVLGRGVLLTALGVSVGLIGASAGARWLQSLLFGIQAIDVQTFVVVGVSFALVALLASYLPARRATKVDPLIALRVE